MTGKKRATKGTPFTGIVHATKGLAVGRIVVLPVSVQVTLRAIEYNVRLSIY